MKEQTLSFIQDIFGGDAVVTNAVKEVCGAIEVWAKLQRGNRLDPEVVDNAFMSAMYAHTLNPFLTAFGGMFKPIVLEVMTQSSVAAKASNYYDAQVEFLIRAVPTCAVNLKSTPITSYAEIRAKMVAHLKSLNG